MANLYWPKKRLLGGKKRSKARRDNAWKKAIQEAPQTLVLSHGFCLDGVTSAIIALRKLDGVRVAYCQPSHIAKVLRMVAATPGNDRQLLITDLSMQTRDYDDIVQALADVKTAGWKTTWLDHHHKQWEDIDLKPLKANLEKLRVDDKMKESGATLTQKLLAPREKFHKQLAETVRDRDLWWNKTPDSETLEFALTEMGVEAFTKHFVEHDGQRPIVDETIAAAAQRERDRQASEAGKILAGTQYYGNDPDRVAIVYGWLPKNTGLHDLIEEGCAMAINIRPNGKMSIRSRKGADVSHIVAAAFKGGGHPNASGGDLGLSGAAYWRYVLARGKTPLRDRLAAVAMDALAHRAEA